MSNFFRQLVARHQGNAETVQPWIPTRFAAVGGESPPTGLPWGERWAETAVAAPQSLPLQPVLLPRVEQEPASPPPIQPLPSVPTVTPADTPTRIETVTRWLHQVERDSPIAQPSESMALPLAGSIAAPTVQSFVSVIETATPTVLPLESPERSPTLTTLVLPPIPSSIELSVPVQPIPMPMPTIQPPTVRVTIGRVEIRAISAPAVSPPEQRRAIPVRRSALSLDAYLQQRSRRT